MRTVILGAGYAGVTAAIRLARRARGRAHVTLVNVSDCFVERIRLHERAAGRVPPRRSIASWLRGTGVTLVVGQARAVDGDARVVHVGDTALPWDRLVLALGSRPDLRTPGAREHALGLDADDAAALAARMPSLAARHGRVLVVGGGLTGLEAATELAESWPGLDVTLVTHGDVGRGFSDGARRHFAGVCARLGISVRAHSAVTRVEPGRLVMTDGALSFDACVWAVGFVGAPLPSGLKLAQNDRGQVLVDPYLRAIGHPTISVAGDLATHAEPPAIAVPMGCKSAGPSGATIADNLVRELDGERPLPFDFVTPFYCVSLGRRDGLIQRQGRDGSLDGPIVRGRLAAWWKELICKSTILALRLERHGLSSYGIFRRGNVPQLPATSTWDREAV